MDKSGMTNQLWKQNRLGTQVSGLSKPITKTRSFILVDLSSDLFRFKSLLCVREHNGRVMSKPNQGFRQVIHHVPTL